MNAEGQVNFHGGSEDDGTNGALPSVQSVQRLSFKNWMVVAIDEELRDYCQDKGINHFYRPVRVGGLCCLAMKET